MSIDMILQVDDSVQLAELIDVLSQCGAIKQEDVPNGFGRGFFPKSNMLYFVMNGTSRDGFPQDIPAPEWPSAYDVAFTYGKADYNANVVDLRCCIRRLAEVTSARFVLSFQRDVTFVLRDGNGVEEIRRLSKLDSP